MCFIGAGSHCTEAVQSPLNADVLAVFVSTSTSRHQHDLILATDLGQGKPPF